MRIVNVVEIKNGLLKEIHSFPIFEEQLSQDRIEEAESLFLKLVRENGISDSFEEDDDIEWLLDESYWEDRNGYEVMISWSNVNL